MTEEFRVFLLKIRCHNRKSKCGPAGQKRPRGPQSVAVVAFVVTFAWCGVAAAAQPERIGVIYLGDVFVTLVDGLRAGLKELGVEEGKQVVLDFHDLKGDAKAAAGVAEKLEREKYKLIFTNPSTVTTAAMKATKNIPMVFAVGSDPVALGYAKSFGQPGGRMTGVQYLARDLTAKRLEILKEFLPKARRVVCFYDPANSVPVEGAKLGREEAKRQKITLVERHVKSINELYIALDALKAGEFDAYLYIPDAMVVSQSQRVVEVTRAKKLPTMFHDQVLVARGGLASYGQSYFEIGKRAAKYVQRVLAGAAPGDLRVETIDDVELAFNLITAKHLAVTIPPNVLARAQKVVR
jgi:putative ABC transport system substrate-binding protein